MMCMNFQQTPCFYKKTEKKTPTMFLAVMFQRSYLLGHSSFCSFPQESLKLAEELTALNGNNLSTQPAWLELKRMLSCFQRTSYSLLLFLFHTSSPSRSLRVHLVRSRRGAHAVSEPLGTTSPVFCSLCLVLPWATLAKTSTHCKLHSSS